MAQVQRCTECETQDDKSGHCAGCDCADTAAGRLADGKGLPVKNGGND